LGHDSQIRVIIQLNQDNKDIRKIS
jgi:hypothetical protein